MSNRRAETFDVAAGSRAEFDLDVAPLGDGSVLRIPVKVIAGIETGPRFVLIAGVHGDEAEGIMALIELYDELDPQHMRGRAVIVPIANPPAFAAGRRTSPLDGIDLNRAFPGRADGQPSERIAHALFHRVVLGSDFLFSLHSWYAHGTVLPFIEVNAEPAAATAASLAAAKASGFERIRRLQWPDGLMVKCANAAGIPGLEAEIGGGGISLPENRARYKQHVLNLMQHLGMLRGRKPGNNAARIHEAIHVRAPSGGMLRLHVGLGEAVQSDDLLATIHDLHGRHRADVRAPRSGTIVAHRTFVSVAPGDNLLTIFWQTSEPRPERGRRPKQGSRSWERPSATSRSTNTRATASSFRSRP